MSELINNNIIIELKIGTPYQIIPVLIKLNQIPFFITSSSYKNDSTKFNSSKSSSYTQDPNIPYISNNYEYNQAFFGEDIISIGNISNKDSFLNRTNFFLATNLTRDNNNIYGEIGLNIINTLYMSFVNQLKNKKKIKDYIFSLKYTTENEGEFHLGNYFHIYDNNYKENDFKNMEVGIMDSYIDNWDLYFYKIYLSNGNNTYTNNVRLSYEFGFILGTWNYFTLIKQIFFDIFESQCEKQNLDKYFYYKCDGNIDLNNFPDLIFFRDELNFTLTKNELWKKFDNKYYFLIIFSENQKDKWILGKILFQKYTILFNLDKKNIGFYPNSINSVPDEQKSQENEKKYSFPFSWILVIILPILLLIDVFYILYYLKSKNRKTRVNELEDNYEYIPQTNQKDPISINN